MITLYSHSALLILSRRLGGTQQRGQTLLKLMGCASPPFVAIKAMHALQSAVKDGKDRFLFKMATGIGKTLASAALSNYSYALLMSSRVVFLGVLSIIVRIYY